MRSSIWQSPKPRTTTKSCRQQARTASKKPKVANQVGKRFDTFAFSSPQFWCAGVADGPRIPLVGDANGDEHADILSLWPNDDCVIDFVLTSAWGKTRPGNQIRTGFGRNPVTVTCGAFTRRKVADMCRRDGSRRVGDAIRNEPVPPR